MRDLRTFVTPSRGVTDLRSYQVSPGGLSVPALSGTGPVSSSSFSPEAGVGGPLPVLSPPLCLFNSEHASAFTSNVGPSASRVVPSRCFPDVKGFTGVSEHVRKAFLKQCAPDSLSPSHKLDDHATSRATGSGSRFGPPSSNQCHSWLSQTWPYELPSVAAPSLPLPRPQGPPAPGAGPARRSTA